MHSWQPHHSRTPPNLSLKLQPQSEEQSRSIKHDTQAFFLKAKEVRMYKYSTVQSALGHSQDKENTYAIAIHYTLHFGRMLIL